MKHLRSPIERVIGQKIIAEICGSASKEKKLDLMLHLIKTDRFSIGHRPLRPGRPWRPWRPFKHQPASGSPALSVVDGLALVFVLGFALLLIHGVALVLVLRLALLLVDRLALKIITHFKKSLGGRGGVGGS